LDEKDKFEKEKNEYYQTVQNEKAYHDKQKKNLDEDISLMQKLKLDVVNDRKQFEEEKKIL